MGKLQSQPKFYKTYTGSSGSLEKIDAVFNWQGPLFEVITPGLSICMDGAKPMCKMSGNIK